MNRFKRIFSALITVGLVVGLVFAWTQRRELQDWWILRSYTAPAEVVALADATTMTDDARNVFYVNRPLVVDEAQFNSACKPESTIVLGCFISRDGIYLYDIEDTRLEGVKQVTAAHELLHAVYERLSTKDKQRIDSLTAEAFAGVTEQRILDTVGDYRARDASVVPNELHSILATEVSTLSPELEEYYAKYFKDRQVIVGFSQAYESEFSNRKDQVANLDAELASLKLEIDAGQNDLALQYSALQAEKNNLDALLSSGDTDGYNARVPGFNAQVSAYNRSVRALEKQINDYNSLVQERNDIALEVQELVESIDSRPQSF